jgi:hypothetical protein
VARNTEIAPEVALNLKFRANTLDDWGRSVSLCQQSFQIFIKNSNKKIRVRGPDFLLRTALQFNSCRYDASGLHD